MADVSLPRAPRPRAAAWCAVLLVAAAGLPLLLPDASASCHTTRIGCAATAATVSRWNGDDFIGEVNGVKVAGYVATPRGAGSYFLPGEKGTLVLNFTYSPPNGASPASPSDAVIVDYVLSLDQLTPPTGPLTPPPPLALDAQNAEAQVRYEFRVDGPPTCIESVAWETTHQTFESPFSVTVTDAAGKPESLPNGPAFYLPIWSAVGASAQPNAPLDCPRVAPGTGTPGPSVLVVAATLVAAAAGAVILRRRPR